jgi:hypothetical protein
MIPKAMEGSMRGLRILLADDNRDCLESLTRLLKLVGHDVLSAGTGEGIIARLHCIGRT